MNAPPAPRAPSASTMGLAALALAFSLGYALVLRAPGASLPPDRAPLGFTHVDQPVYYACARELFENGNGLFYAQPYDNDPASPRIYTHFVHLLFGWTWRLTGLSLPAIDLLTRILAGALMLFLGAQTIRAGLPEGPLRLYGAAAAILLSGAAWTIAAGRVVLDWALAGGYSFAEYAKLFPDLFAEAEGGYGEWHLNLQRNLLFAPEAVYHSLFFGCALALLTGRRRLALGLLFLAWWSHPFTGAELGIVGAAWLTVERLLNGRAEGRAWAGAWGINALFLAYYFLFLARDPGHAGVEARLRKFGNPFLFSMIPAAYGALPLLAAAFLARRGILGEFRGDPRLRFFLVWGCAVWGLVLHDRILFFMEPRMPMHFTRGYEFLPILYFAVLGLRRLFGERLLRGDWLARGALAALLILQAPDNFLHLAQVRRTRERTDGVHSMARPLARLLARLDQIPERLTIAGSGLGLDYAPLASLIPVLTRHRSVAGHHLNTPFLEERLRDLASLSPEGGRAVLDKLGVEALIVRGNELDRWKTALAPERPEVLFELDGLACIRLRRGGKASGVRSTGDEEPE